MSDACITAQAEESQPPHLISGGIWVQCL